MSICGHGQFGRYHIYELFQKDEFLGKYKASGHFAVRVCWRMGPSIWDRKTSHRSRRHGLMEAK